MGYAGLGFLFGVLIPSIARRFEKFMPATFAYALYRIVKINRKIPLARRLGNIRYRSLFKSYLWRSVLWGLAGAAVTFGAYHCFGESGIWWIIGFFWCLMLLAEIDYRTLLLPDILTSPLLIAGFLYSTVTGQWAGAFDSAAGAAYGYAVPIAASLLFIRRNRDVFGGGDVKLLAAIGAWFGLDRLLYAIILAAVLFGGYAAVARKRSGAFGPALGAAAIAVAFWFFRG